MNEHFVVVGEANSGSVAVEAALTLIGTPYGRVETTTDSPDGAPGTPMGQAPVLILPGGEVMTESAAILIWLADRFPAAALAPAIDSPLRAAFLRWMTFISAAIYAHYWARDFPQRLLSGEAAQQELRARLNARIAHGWSVMEAAMTPGRYLLGETIGVLDLYAAVVSRWTPRKSLHETVAPRIGEVVRRVEAEPRLAALWTERFPLKRPQG